MRAYKQANDHTMELTNKKDGKVIATARIVVSPNGKSCTVSAPGTDAKGKKITSTSVYDKE